ncbi:hypothetical protein PoB_001944100 [Plakobranchus ocellatus]|uniref:Reverse transcriptase domain-containing protein n=1 Tax=Plakobranchus ocellatus TaxID=259542 RepID=A0AAV3ZE77_9GAST|nr:hypothetical protein PoB_001944100 [Plakobranchus ocellatus]
MYRWIKSFLGERYIRTRVRGTLSRARPTRDGLPQGSALSCTLFLCYINDISDGLPAESKLAYADDIVIWQHDTDVDRATEAINRDLVALKRYCDRWKLQINTVKTVYSVFSNSNQVLAKYLNVRLGEDFLQRDNLPRYLGVALDPRLNLTKHVENVAISVRERIGLLHKLASTNWGANLRSLRTIYVSYVRPLLEYANPVLNLASTKSLEKLERVQNAALRLITGGIRSTPIAILQLATNLNHSSYGERNIPY